MMEFLLGIYDFARVELLPAGRVLAYGIFFGAGAPILYTLGVKIYAQQYNVNPGEKIGIIKKIFPLFAYLIFMITAVLVTYGVYHLSYPSLKHYFH